MFSLSEMEKEDPHVECRKNAALSFPVSNSSIITLNWFLAFQNDRESLTYLIHISDYVINCIINN